MFPEHNHNLLEWAGIKRGKPNKDSDFKKPENPLSKLKNQPTVENMRDFCFYYNYIKDRGFQVAVPEMTNTGSTYFPDYMIVTNSSMHRNMRKFGDLLYMDFFPDAIVNHSYDGRTHNLIVWFVIDTNMRLLLVGWALTTS